jgi:murein DD-endopeptidase MepM/ murein hydrolase activator NlpD
MAKTAKTTYDPAQFTGWAAQVAGKAKSAADVDKLAPGFVAGNPAHQETLNQLKLKFGPTNMEGAVDFTGDQKVTDQPTAPAPEVPGATDPNSTLREQTPEAVVDGSWLKTHKTGESLGLGNVPSSLQEYIDFQKNYQAGQEQRKGEQAAQATKIEHDEFAMQEEGAQSGVQGLIAQMSPGREGLMSGTAKQLMGQYKANVERKLEIGRSRLSLANKQRENALVQLKHANESNNINMAKNAQAQLANAEMEIMQTQTRMLAEQRLDVETALKVQDTMSDIGVREQAQKNANLTAFSGLIESGVELKGTQVKSMADQMGISFDLAYGYYDGMQNIRDDKSLSLEEKQVKMDQMNKDFEEGWLGERDDNVKKATYFNGLVQSGLFSKEQLQTLSGAMSLPDEYNLSYQAELKYNNAKADIAEFEAKYQGNPPPEGSSERLAYDIKQLELKQAEMELQESVDGFSQSAANEILGSEITQKYDSAISYSIPGQRDGKHDGLDYVVTGGLGADVKAPVSGIARIVNDPNPGETKGWGNQVIITDAAGRDHMFGHLNNINVQNGDIIMAGQVIGGQGNTGFTMGETGIHVDYRIKGKEGYIDPEEFLKNPPSTNMEGDLAKYTKEFVDAGLSKEKAVEKAIDRVETDKKNAMTVRDQIAGNKIAIDTIDEMLGGLSRFDTGLTGTVSSWIPATDAYDIDADLETIKAIVGFAKLKAMRDASKTGGALGQVSEMENKLLQSVLGSLSQGQSREKFVKNLTQVKDSLKKLNKAAMQDMGGGESAFVEEMDVDAILAEEDDAMLDEWIKDIPELT